MAANGSRTTTNATNTAKQGAGLTKNAAKPYVSERMPGENAGSQFTDGGKISAKRARWTYSEETNPPITNEYLVRKYGAENVQQGGGRFLETRERVAR